MYIIIIKNYYFFTVLYKHFNNLEATCSKCSNYVYRSEFKNKLSVFYAFNNL